jgi:hypothetical protein
MDHQSVTEQDERRTLVAATLAGIGVLGFYLVLMADYLPAFHPFSDDAGVIVNSCTPWLAASRWTEWFTKGWASYAVNYPDWGPFGNNTMKPVVNLVFLLEGKLTPLLGDGAFLLFSYLAPAVTAFALVFAFRRLANTRISLAVLFALVVSTSAVWLGSLVNAVDMTNTLALMFSCITLAMLPIGDERPSVWNGLGLAAVQLLAIYSHESALVLPAVAVTLLFALSSRRLGVRDLWPFVVPLVLWGAVRLFVLQARSGVYALTAGGALNPKVWGYWLINSVVPIDVRGLWMARGLAPMQAAWQRPLVLAALVTVIAVNLMILAALMWWLARKPTRRSLLLALAFALATVPHLTTAFDPLGARFAGLSMVTGLLALIVLYSDKQRLLIVCASILLAAHVLYGMTGLVQHKLEAKADSLHAASYTAYIHDAAARYRPHSIVVVNDRVGQFDVEAMVKFAAWPYTGFNVVALNNLSTGDLPGGRLAVTRQGDQVVVDDRITGTSAVSFFGADRVDFAVPNQGFAYTGSGPVTSPRSFIARGPVDTGGTLVVGYEPDGRLLTPRYYR